jgi:DNA-directed RNA polymerase subunit omega
MARVTVEDCLERVPNRFALTILAASRARQLSKGSRPLVACTNKNSVTALREIAGAKVKFNEDVRGAIEEHLIETRRRGELDDAKSLRIKK